MTLNSKKLVLFDLDGTLVDSVDDLIWSVQQMLGKLDLQNRSAEQVRSYVGNGSTSLIKRVLTGEMDGEPDPVLQDQAMSVFLDIYALNLCQFSSLYPNVEETLGTLHNSGRNLAVVTNKPEQFVQPLLQALSIDQYFVLVLAGDTLERMKPDPLPLFHAAEKLGATIEQTVMIGDSVNDVLAAANADMTSVAVTYGYNHGHDIRSSNPDIVIDDFNELPPLFQLP